MRITQSGVASAVQVNTACACGSFTRTGTCSGGFSSGIMTGDVPVNPDSSCTCELSSQQIPVAIQRDGKEIARGLGVQGDFAGATLVVEGHEAVLPDAFPAQPQLGATQEGYVGWSLPEPLTVLVTVTSFADGTAKTCREPGDTNYAPVKWPSAGGGFVSVSAQHVVETDGLHVWFETGLTSSVNGGF